MIIPKELKIGGHLYKVVLDKESEAGTAGSHICGSTDRKKGIISIQAALCQTEREGTLLHEILHVMNNQINETLIESLSQQLYQVLKDNNLIK